MGTFYMKRVKGKVPTKMTDAIRTAIINEIEDADIILKIIIWLRIQHELTFPQIAERIHRGEGLIQQRFSAFAQRVHDHAAKLQNEMDDFNFEEDGLIDTKAPQNPFYSTKS